MNLKKRKEKTQRSSSKIVTSETFQRVTDETLQESHLKFGITDEAQNFQIQKKKKKKWKAQNYGRQNKLSKTKIPQRSSFKITTCERFQMVNNDALQEQRQVRQLLGTI